MLRVGQVEEKHMEHGVIKQDKVRIEPIFNDFIHALNENL